MITHTLKIREPFYDSLTDNGKTCEIRKNDRDFQKGDRIAFQVIHNPREHEPEDINSYYNDNFLITHVLRFPEGLKKWYVALSVELIEETGEAMSDAEISAKNISQAIKPKNG